MSVPADSNLLPWEEIIFQADSKVQRHEAGLDPCANEGIIVQHLHDDPEPSVLVSYLPIAAGTVLVMHRYSHFEVVSTSMLNANGRVKGKQVIIGY